MGLRTAVASWLVGTSISIGRSLGADVAVTLDNQTVDVDMVVPGSEDGRVWDGELYAKGMVYYAGYANPIKPVVSKDSDVEKRDTALVYTNDDGGPYTEMMVSERYKTHMSNHMISELVTPDEKWNKVVLGMVLLGALIMVSSLISVLVATGTL